MRLLLSLILVLWAGVAIAQSTEDDRNFITGLIEDAINNDDLTVRLINFQGALSSEATADAITIADPEGIWLRLDDLTISWNRSALLSGRVEIETINAARIEVIRLPVTPEAPTDLSGAEAKPFSLPDLPVAIDIADLSADEIVLTEDLLGEPVAARFLGAIKLGGGAGSADFTLERTDGKVGQFVVDASYDNETRQLGLSILAEEGEDGIAARLLDLPGRPSVKLQITGDAPLVEFAADIALATDNVDRVTGTVVLSRPAGTIDQNFNVDLRGDLRPLIADQYDPFFGASTVLRVEGSALGVGGLRLSNLIIAADQVVLRGSAELDAQGWPAKLDLRGRLGNGDGSRVLLPISGNPVEVSGMSLNVKFDAAEDSAWTGAFDITSLTREGISIDVLALSGGGTIIPGAGETRGGFSANLDYAARGLVLDDPAFLEAVGSDLTGNIAVSRTEGGLLRISNLTLDGAGITAQAFATVDGLEGRFETTFDVGLDAEDFNRFSSLTGIDLGGSGAVDATGSVRPFDGIFDVRLSAVTQDLSFGIDEIDPLLTGQTNLSVTAERDEFGTRLRDLRLIGETLSAQGNVTLTGTTAAATLSAALADLSRVAPGLSGPAMLSANVETDEDGVINLVSTVTAPSARADVDVVATPITDGYVVRGDGTVRADDLRPYSELVNQQLAGGVTIELNGEYLTPTGAASAVVSAATRDVRIGNAAVDKIIAGMGRITANVSLSEARRLRLDALDVVFPNLTATGAVATSGNDTTANLSVRLRDVALLFSDFSGPLLADISARQDANGWAVTGDATGPVATSARVTGRVSNSGQLDLSVTGAAPLALANLYIAPRQISGLARFNLSVNGPPALSSVRGPITISDARLAAPVLQQAIEDMNGTLQLAGGTLRVDLSGRSGDGGNLTLTGPVNLAPPFQASLTAQLSNVVFRDPTLYRTTANGSVTVTGPLSGGAAIAGTIDLGEAEVQVPSTGVSALGKLPEVTHLGPRLEVLRTLDRADVTAQGTSTQPTTASNRPDYPVNLLIRAPSRIFVRGRGLDAELGGQLRLTGSLRNLIPIGRFDLVRGRLSILGQRFDLDEGYAQLQGDFTPYLRLVATTEASTGTVVRIILEGPASDIEVRFESTPELPQDEVLAQLLFGRDISSISPLQAVQLASAVATLAGNGGGVVGNIRDELNLDDLDFVTDEEGNAGVRAGKYLSENIYTDVTIGSDGTSEINLNIDINRNFTARGTVSTDGETSVGVFFERDY